MKSRDLSNNQVQAVKFATEVIGHYTKDGRISIPELDPALSEVVAAFTAVHQRRGDGREEVIGYEMTAEGATKIRELFVSVKRAHEYILTIARLNILLGYPVPEPIRMIVADKLNSLAGPPPDGGMRNVRERDILFVILAEWMKKALNVPRFSDTKFSAAQAIWAAYTALNMPVSENQVGKVIREKTAFREYYTSHGYLIGIRSPVIDALLGKRAIPDFSPQATATKSALSRLGHTLRDGELN
jgi:hypothetical protein